MKRLSADYSIISEDEFGEGRLLHFIAERWYFRTGNYAGLSILLMESLDVQKADIVSIGGKDDFFSWGAEDDFANHARETLQELGFTVKMN